MHNNKFPYALICMALATSVEAQQQDETGQKQGDSESVEVISVTASRIKNSNLGAPTPVSMVTDEQIEQRGVTNVVNLINEMPAFTGTLTNSSTNLNSRQNGINAVDLRGLGTNRNLVLVNGRRVTPFDEFGNIDLNAVPSLAVKRVEVVTGGASAAWGSDAVSGVINLIFDNTLDGVKLNLQYGQSGEGDAEDTRLAFAWGGFFDDSRGHVLIAADYNKNKGIPEGSARDWQRRSPAFVPNTQDTGPSDGIPQFMFRDNAVLFLASPNGITLPGNEETSNLEFFSDGTYGPRELGDIAGNFMFGGSGPRLADRAALLIPLERANVLVSMEYDFDNNIQFFGEASFAQSESLGSLIDAFSFGDVVIQPDNAYLPDGLGALNEPFALYRTFEEFSPISSESVSKNFRVVAGLSGELNTNWDWEFASQYGQTEFTNDQLNNLKPANLVLAADAVNDEQSGGVVCRANANGQNNAPGCMPINLFGKGSPSAAAIEYITGTGTSDTKIEQTVISGTVNGKLFDAWAGPLLASFGLEYRKEELSRTVNEPNDEQAFLLTNTQPLAGDFNVTEGFLEVSLPLIDNEQLLDFNGAVRYTDYSTIGQITTWKAGLVYSPIDDLRFRGSVSRDIRAPSIGETFVETVTTFDNVSNPFTGEEDFTHTPTTGNINLQEETALTKTVGVVYSSNSLSFSLDWYNIDLEDAIGTLMSQDIVDRCFQGESGLCDLITFEPDQSISKVINQNLNLGVYEVEGIDFEGRYGVEAGEGEINIGLLVSYLISKDIAPSGGEPIDVAGDLGRELFGTPELKGTLSVGYKAELWQTYAQLRLIGDGYYNPQFTPEQLSREENRIGSVTYVDVSANYDISDSGSDTKIELFAGIDNLFDRDPPIVPGDFISNLATQAMHYDVVGRKFYVGLRAEF